MREKYKRQFITIIGLYAFVYLLAYMLNNDELMIVLKPGATLLAWISVRFYTPMLEANRSVKKLVSIAFITWFVADIIAMVGELIILTGGQDPQYFYNLEIVLYAFSRVFILLTVAALYLYVTKKTSKFQVMADLITLITCISTAIWLVIFNDNTSQMMGLLSQGDILSVFSIIYICLSLTIQGVLLLNWLYFKERTITLGHKVGLTGLAIITFIDLICAFYPVLLYQGDVIDLAFKVGILLVAIGGVFFDRGIGYGIIFKNGRLETESWKNGFYFFAYPLFVFLIIGINIDIFIFFMIIAFYMVCCLYTRQIDIANDFLEKEKAYNEKLKLYSEVLEQAPLSIVITDVEGTIEYSNPYFTKIAGYPKEEALGKNPRILKSGKTSPQEYAVLWNKLLSGKEWSGEFTNIDKEGRLFNEKSTIVPIKNENAVTTHYVAIKENITLAKKMEESLKNQHYFTMQLLDAMPSGIFYVSKDDVLLGMNTRLKQHYGFREECYENVHLSQFPGMSRDEYRGFCMMKEKTMATGKPYVQQAIYKDASGKKGVALYALSVYYLADGTVGGFLGLFTDITELKDKEGALEIALTKANAATEAKSQFLANMSHEIRTPMNAIIGMSYLTLQTELNPRQEDYVIKIHSAATSLLGIINDILDFSKIESGRLELETIDFNLEKVVTDSFMLLMEKASEKKLKFLSHLPPQLPKWFRGDPLRLGQILTNLVGNAIKFTEVGEIEVDISQEATAGNRQLIRFSIKDTGMGIRQENLDKLFEPFTQSDNSITRNFGGSGLGLTICQNLVEMMGGELRAESTVGQGSTFTFNIWLETSSSEVTKTLEIPSVISENRGAPKITTGVVESPAIEQLGCLNGINVLLAEDNPLNRQIAEELLTQQGATVATEENGQKVLDRILTLEEPDHYDLILMDLQMPVMDGFEATRKIRVVNRTIPILAMTARTMLDEKEACVQAGMNDHISKPINPDLLYNTILKYVKPSLKKMDEPAALKPMAPNQVVIPEIAGIDMELAMKRVEHDPSLYLSLLKIFAETQGSMASDMKRSIGENNQEELKRQLHTAKSVMGNIGAIELFNQVKAMEERYNQHGIDETLKQQILAYSRQYDRLQATIGKALDTIDRKKADQENNADNRTEEKAVDQELISRLIEQLGNLLEDGDSDAVTHFNGNKKALAGVWTKEQLNELEQWILLYEFDEALEVMNRFNQKNG